MTVTVHDPVAGIVAPARVNPVPFGPSSEKRRAAQMGIRKKAPVQNRTMPLHQATERKRAAEKRRWAFQQYLLALRLIMFGSSFTG